MQKRFAGLLLAAAMTTGAFAAPTIENLRIEDGVASVVLNNSQSDLLICQITAFGSSTRDFSRLPLTGPSFPVTGTGADVVIASDAAILGHTGATQAGAVAVVEDSTGDFIVWDEQFRGGSDTMLRITPAGVVSTAIALADLDPTNAAGGVEGLAIAGDDTLLVWNQFPASGGTRGLFLFPAPYGPGTRITLAEQADIRDGINAAVPGAAPSGSGIRVPIGGLAAHEPSVGNDLVVAVSCINNNAVYSITFDKTNLAAAPTYGVLVSQADMQAFTGQTTTADVRQRAIAFDGDGNLYLYTAQGVDDADGKLVRVDVFTTPGTPQFTELATQQEILDAVASASYTNVQYNSIQVDENDDIYMGLYGSGATGRIIKVTPDETTNVPSWELY